VLGMTCNRRLKWPERFHAYLMVACLRRCLPESVRRSRENRGGQEGLVGLEFLA